MAVFCELILDPVFDLTNLFATLQPHSPPPTPVTQLPALSTPTATAWASLPPAMNDPDQAVQDFFMQLEMKETLVDKSQDQASSSSSSSSSTSSPSSPSQSSLPASTITASTAHDPSVGVSVSSIMDELFSRTITADKHAQMQIMGPTMDEDMMSDDKMDHGLYMTSVLRKRKIKMRKHKYKKLRKRTRQSSRQNQGRQGATQFQPFQTFQQQQQQQFGGGGGVGPGCRSRDRVYLPDMQSFLIQGSLTYPEAIQACQACGSELVLVDGTNIDRFREAFTSLGLYGDQKLWIKSWFGESVEVSSACPAVQIDPLMGNRLTPIEENCLSRLFALCY
ncbi:hypothetical protein BG004_005370 [Podila humilis]|nr:hypothetical protein BG004_005370 [Podila humilis]